MTINTVSYTPIITRIWHLVTVNFRLWLCALNGRRCISAIIWNRWSNFLYLKVFFEGSVEVKSNQLESFCLILPFFIFSVGLTVRFVTSDCVYTFGATPFLSPSLYNIKISKSYSPCTSSESWSKVHQRVWYKQRISLLNLRCISERLFTTEIKCIEMTFNVH